ncbi:MAG TPA: sigma-70 family RNA polymerase sigma factor [Candidatus Acidoferrum sp.]|jgi:RNA polymerase sigma-70 factor (ECF subfamily)|nr:sigma-70 family RNA polymerase sigma factor [Candidatus Acidoferrum sp.]
MVDQQTAEEPQAQLLRRVAAQDVQALSEFYDLTARPLFSLAVRILGDAGEAEEVIQDVFVQIWNKAASFDPLLGSAFHWALSIARHRSIDRLRARQRRARLLEGLENDAAANAPACADSASGELKAEDTMAVLATLNRLPPEQRCVIDMAFFGGLTHQEIAETLHQPLGTIKARIRRGLLRLRDSLRANA